MTIYKGPKPPRPTDPGPQSPRRPGTVKVKAHHRFDALKGWLLIRSHWRRGNRSWPKDPPSLLLELIVDHQQHAADGWALQRQIDAAFVALNEWDPTHRRKWSPPPVPGDDEGATTQPRPVREAYRVVMEASLKTLTRLLDDEVLAGAGLQRLPAACIT